MVKCRSVAIRQLSEEGRIELRLLVRGDDERRSGAGDPVVVQSSCDGKSLLIRNGDCDWLFAEPVYDSQAVLEACIIVPMDFHTLTSSHSWAQRVKCLRILGQTNILKGHF